MSPVSPVMEWGTVRAIVFLCVSACVGAGAAHAQTPLTPFPQPIRVANPNGGGGGGGSVSFPLLAPNGSSAAPSYSFVLHPSAGLFYGSTPFPGPTLVGDAGIVNIPSFVTLQAGIGVFSDTTATAAALYSASGSTERYQLYTSGTTALEEWREDAAPSSAGAGFDALYADSASHCFMLRNNGGGFHCVASALGSPVANQVAFYSSATVLTGGIDLTFTTGSLAVGKTGEAGAINIIRSSDGALAAQFSVFPVTEAAYVSSTKDFEIFSSGFIRFNVDGPNGKTTSTLPFFLTEGTMPAPSAGFDAFAADATSHTAQLSNNGDAFAPVARNRTSFLATNATNATATPADTGLSVTLDIGNWSCNVTAVAEDSTAGDGIVISENFAGTTTGVRSSSVSLIDNAGAVTDNSQGTLVSVTAATFAKGSVRITWNLGVSVAGVFKVQFAQNAHSTGTAQFDAAASLVCTRL